MTLRWTPHIRSRRLCLHGWTKELSRYISEKNPNADRLPLILGILDGLNYLHTRKQPVIHGDLRASNVLVSDTGRPCLADFGLSRVLSQNHTPTSSNCGGSVRWMAPEVLNGSNMSEASDIWAFGMIILEITTGKRPYLDISIEPLVIRTICDRIIPSRPDTKQAPSLTDKLWEICLECWHFDPQGRPATSQLLKKISRIKPI